MKEPNRPRKGEIKEINKLQLNEEQKEAKRLILDNQIVIITGVAGTGKSLVASQAGLDFLFKKQTDKILVTRATIEVGKSLGFLPGELSSKFNPYIEAIIDNLKNCSSDKEKIDKLVEDGKVLGVPLQFIRGKTLDSYVIAEECQNMTKHEMLALLSRLGKHGKIVITGDNEQRDIREEYTGLSYAIELSKNIPEIKRINLKENHRSGLVGKILEYEYRK